MLFRVILLMAAALSSSGLAASHRPNILLAISDDQSFPHASAYGAAFVKTPAFDRVAAAGVLFHNAFVASPGCSPSRAALLTGRHPWQIEHAGTHASSFSKNYPVYPDLLEAAGYFVGYTGKGWGPGNHRAGGRTRNPAGPDFNSRKASAEEGISANDYAANFSDFLAQRPKGSPFCFWFGAHEPHRVFKPGIGVEHGGRLETVGVPPFLPDTGTVRQDLLDYGYEIQWFDRHLARMLDELDQAGLLENTIVVVTSDNGMSFPRAKANAYEYGIHVPLAIAWPDRVPGHRETGALFSLIDLAPTFLAAAEVSPPADPAMTGVNWLPYLCGIAEAPPRDFVLAGRERHSSARYQNRTYPQRALRTPEHLLIWNLKPDRWPAGDPQKFENDGTLGPMHGGYHDIDACPTLDELIRERESAAIAAFFHVAVDKRPEFELFDILSDPGCLQNVAESNAVQREALTAELMRRLKATGDTRLGPDPEVWETYPRYSPIRTFPAPRDSGKM